MEVPHRWVMTKKSMAQTVTIGGHRLRVTNLDKVIYPEAATTKAQVLDYYVAIADVLLPHTRDRPATRKRWVDGVGTADEPGVVFFQKNLDDSAPSWVKRRPLEHKHRTNEYPLVNNAATLAWFAQISALEIHVPQWRFGRNGAVRNPDRLVLDLDPGEDVGLLECAEVARWARAILKDVGLEAVPVTSGSKGIHLYAPLDGSLTSDQASAFAKELAQALEAQHPDLVVSTMERALRGGKVFIDWGQNNASKTTVARAVLAARPPAALRRGAANVAGARVERPEAPRVHRGAHADEAPQRPARRARGAARRPSRTHGGADRGLRAPRVGRRLTCAVPQLGCAPGLGFVHTCHVRSFVYDVADLYKAEITIPIAFSVVASNPVDVEAETRHAVRDAVQDGAILPRCARDIKRLLMPDDPETLELEESNVVRLWDGGNRSVVGGTSYGDDQW